MRSIIHATSVIGCSTSLVFCLLAILVLSCYREKTRLLLIKQQQSITLAFINIVMLCGFQGLQSEKLCQVATTLLHYFVLACFSWQTADQYFILKSVVKMKPYVNFKKMFIASWGFPVPFLILQLLIGYLLDQDIGSVLYSCWGSDLVALTLLIPAGGLSIASITMLITTVKSVIKRPAPTTYTKRKTDQAIKYGIKASSVMIFITLTVWFFAHLLFWYPDNINLQLLFALSTGYQGSFQFFFYCVFALELDIYVSDKLFSATDDIDEFTRDTGPVKLSSFNSQDIQNMESLRRPQKKKRNGSFIKEDQDLPSMIQEEPLSFQKCETTPTTPRSLSDPIPRFSFASRAKTEAPFGANKPVNTARIERDKSHCEGNGPEEDAAFSSVLNDVDISPLSYLRPIQSAERSEQGKRNATVATPLLLARESFLSSRTEKQHVESKQSSSMPTFSAPNPKRYVLAPEDPRYALGREIWARHESNTEPYGNGLRRRSGIMDSCSLPLLATEQPSTPIELLRPGNMVNGASRKSIPTMKNALEPDFTNEKEKLHFMTMMQVQPYCGAMKGLGQGEMTESSSYLKCYSPMDDVNPFGSRDLLQRRNSDELEKNFSCMVSDSGGEKNLSPKVIRRGRTSVPCLKFALNELESLFSNQDLFSAAERKLSANSDNPSQKEESVVEKIN